MKWFKGLLAVGALALGLTGCGGGGSNAGSSVFGGGSTGGTGGTGGTTGNATMTVAVSGAVTPSSPATVTITLKDSTGAGVANKLVTLDTKLKSFAVVSPTSVTTGSDGTATATLTAISGASGADEVIAAADLGGTSTLQGTAAFTVKGASSSITASASTTTVKRSAPVTFTASVHDSAGAAVAGQLVNFSSANGLVSFSAQSALTDSSGNAQVLVTPQDPTTNAADVLIATTTVNNAPIQSSVAVNLVAEVPSLVLSLSSSSVSTSSPATVRAAFKDPSGNPLVGKIVSFTSTLGAFDVASAVTDSQGVASATLSPKTTSTAGADTITAQGTYNGASTTASAVVTFVASTSSGNPVLVLALSSTTVTAAAPATATATLTDASGKPIVGQVINFSSVGGLASFNVSTALTDAQGSASVTLTPASSTSAGADNVKAATTYAGQQLQVSKGFTVQATDVSITSFTSGVQSLSAYGQTSLSIVLSGASVTAPVNLSISSACAAAGKATVSPQTTSATSNTVVVQYTDNGCGALQTADQLQVSVVGTATTKQLSLPIAAPAVSSLAFNKAVPTVIYLKGSGLGEASIVSFQVRDAAGNPLPNQDVKLSLLTTAGGVTMEGGTADITRTSDASGLVSARINSGTVPTPVRVAATLVSNSSVATVSSGLSVAVGLPSELNFSLSEATRNIEGYDIDGTANTYSIIASDRVGNPVPAGTSINFVTTGGQIEATSQTQLLNGLARTSVNYVSSDPRPTDGRVTVTAYALGEESFLDLNGNNIWDSGEPFQDLGNVFIDRNLNGTYDASGGDQYIPLSVNNSSACQAPTNSLLALDNSIPSMPNTCDGTWSGAGHVYVRRALQTVLSTSSARPLWLSVPSTAKLCSNSTVALRTDATTATTTFNEVSGADLVYVGTTSTKGSLSFIVADANPVRLNPMAAGTTIAVAGTTNFSVTLAGGSPVPSSLDATGASVNYEFQNGETVGTLTLTIKSPSGFGTSVSVGVQAVATTTACP
jgi:hypothetical protein